MELVTAPSESLPTRQNGGENRDKAVVGCGLERFGRTS